MRINYDTRLASWHVIKSFYLGWFVYIIALINIHLQNRFGKSEKSILQTRNITITERPFIFYCHLPYDDCLCSIIHNQSNTSYECVGYSVLVGSRVLPLISFFSQIALVQVVFSISTDRRAVVICTLWIISLFSFIVIIIGIYWNRCSHAFITSILGFTGTVLSCFGVVNILVGRDRVDSSVNSNQIEVVEKLKEDNKQNKSWQELI
jgi:hypothetical protein